MAGDGCGWKGPAEKDWRPCAAGFVRPRGLCDMARPPDKDCRLFASRRCKMGGAVFFRLRLGLSRLGSPTPPFTRGAYRSWPVYASAVNSTMTSDRFRLAASKLNDWTLPGPAMWAYRSKKPSSWNAGEWRMGLVAIFLTSSECAL